MVLDSLQIHISGRCPCTCLGIVKFHEAKGAALGNSQDSSKDGGGKIQGSSPHSALYSLELKFKHQQFH